MIRAKGLSSSAVPRYVDDKKFLAFYNAESLGKKDKQIAAVQENCYNADYDFPLKRIN